MEIEFAQTMKYVVEMYPDAEVIRVVLGNLNMHKMASLYEPFPLEKARVSPRIWNSITRPSTAVGSLNTSVPLERMAEMEFSVLSRTCLASRVSDEEALRRRINANVAKRNAKHQSINWHFTIRDAHSKLHRFYPSTSA